MGNNSKQNGGKIFETIQSWMFVLLMMPHVGPMIRQYNIFYSKQDSSNYLNNNMLQQVGCVWQHDTRRGKE
jgi:hypothetical protein